MSDSQNRLPSVESCLLPKVFRSFRLAIHPGKMIIAFAAIVIICLAGWLMDHIRKTVVAGAGIVGTTNELQVYLNEPEQFDTFVEINKETGERRGVYSVLWHFAAVKFQNGIDAIFNTKFREAATDIGEYFKATVWAFKHHTVYCVIFGLIKLVVICIAGGAMCRISALQFARGEKPGVAEALNFSRRKFASFIGAPVFPVAIALVAGLCIFLLGLLGSIRWVGDFILAIGLIPALMAGTLIAILFIFTLAGFNLMFPAIAYENMDCFDAISRSFNYVWSRPWRMALYTAAAIVHGAICYMFVRLVAFLMLFCTRLFLYAGGCFVAWFAGLFGAEWRTAEKYMAIWPQPEIMNLQGSAVPQAAVGTQVVAAFVIQLFVLAVVGLVMAFILSFYFSANSIIYALLRNKVDNTPLDEVRTEPEESLEAESAAAEPQTADDSSTESGESD